jgi:hypothetical protein
MIYLGNSRNSSVGISDGLLAGWSEFYSRQGQEIFLFSTMSRLTLGPTQPPIQLIPEALPLGLKRPGREADHPPPSSAEVKNAGAILHLPHTSSWRDG